jgi:hypothetical protein
MPTTFGREANQPFELGTQGINNPRPIGKLASGTGLRVVAPIPPHFTGASREG